jgi:thiol-disulfide isomerase/thioredoxin
LYATASPTPYSVNMVSYKKHVEKKHGLSTWEKAGIPLIILVVAWVAYSAVQPSASNQQQTKTSVASLSQLSNSQYAPDFTLPVISVNGPTGASISLSSLRGRVVLLEFMEPWCPHCQSMVPTLEQLHAKYGNVTFISVSGPWDGVTQSDVAKFMSYYGSSWTYLFDSSGSVMNMYGVNATPTFFVINKNGSIAVSLQGDQSYATLENILVQSLQS